MTKFLNDRFSINNAGNEKYAKGWDSIDWGKKEEPTVKISLDEDDLKVEREIWANLQEAFGKTFRTSDIRKQVEEFHVAFDHPVAVTPTVPDPATLKLRLNLIAEEFVELLEACGADDVVVRDLNDTIAYALNAIKEDLEDFDAEVDLVEVADALGDLDYVIEGMRLTCGINGGPIADEIHRSNMSKLGANGKPVRREDGKTLKGPNFSPPDIASCLRDQGWDG